MFRHLQPVAVLLTVLLATLPGRAADLDPYLPEDTQTIINVNVRQLLDSPIVKKNFLEMAQEALRGQDQVQDILKDLGFDPFKDLDRVIIASPGGTEKDRGLVIVHGRFDVAKFKAKGEDAAKDHPDNLKIQKVLGGKHTLYEVNMPDMDDPLFVAVAGRDTMLVSAGKDYVIDALKKAGKTDKPALKDKNFQNVLEKVDERQSLSLAVVKSPDIVKATRKLRGDVKDMIDKVQALGGGLTISDEVKLELIITTKNAKEAKDLGDSTNKSLKLILGLAAAFTQNESSPEAEFVVELIKSLRVTSKEEAVLIKGRISSDLIEDTIKKKSK
jgi:hypothetical protein